jgi:hypothetical protein
MKALSLRQPWAWLVVHGGKNVENRKWYTAYRGPFLIHAAKGMTEAEYDGACDFVADRFGKAASQTIPDATALERGGIVGECNGIVGVLPPDWPLLPCGHVWHMHEQYGFLLRAVRPLPFRSVKGSLGFFDAPE